MDAFAQGAVMEASIKLQPGTATLPDQGMAETEAIEHDNAVVMAFILGTED